MTKDAVNSWKLNSVSTRTLLIGAQVLALIIFILALEFLWRTTGGTLFLFSTIAPVLALLAAIAVLGVAIYRFLRRHSLFEIRELKAGQVVFQQGEEGDCAYFIHNGEVEVVRQEDGVQQVDSGQTKFLNHAQRYAAHSGRHHADYEGESDEKRGELSSFHTNYE